VHKIRPNCPIVNLSGRDPALAFLTPWIGADMEARCFPPSLDGVTPGSLPSPTPSLALALRPHFATTTTPLLVTFPFPFFLRFCCFLLKVKVILCFGVCPLEFDGGVEGGFIRLSGLRNSTGIVLTWEALSPPSHFFIDVYYSG